MEKKVNKLDKSRVEISCQMDWLEFEPYLEKALSSLGKNATVKGFRPGKAPRKAIEREIGKDKILAEAAQLAVQEEYSKVVKEQDLEPISPPQAEILKLAQDNPFSFKIKVEILPEIELPDYGQISSDIVKKEVKVEEKDIESTLQWLQQSRAQFKDLARPAQKGDFVRLKYQSPQLENNKEFVDGFVLGKGSLVKGFEENIQGMKAGEAKEFSVEFPKDYFRKELAGKKADFKLKIEKVQEMELPKLDDQLAKTLGDFKDLEALKKSINQGIEKEKVIEELHKRREEILEKIAQQCKFELPESLLVLEREKALKALEKPTEEQKEQAKELAEKRVKNFLLIRAIGRKEKIEVTDKESEEAASQFLANQPETVQGQIDLNQLEEYYKGVLYNQKTLEKLCPQ